MAKQFDNWMKDTVEMTAEDIAKCTLSLTEQMKSDIRFQHAQVTNFAREQVKSIHEFSAELHPGTQN